MVFTGIQVLWEIIFLDWAAKTIFYSFLFVMAVLVFLGTNTTTTQRIPTKPTTLSPDTTTVAGTDKYYLKSK